MEKGKEEVGKTQNATALEYPITAQKIKLKKIDRFSSTVVKTFPTLSPSLSRVREKKTRTEN